MKWLAAIACSLVFVGTAEAKPVLTQEKADSFAASEMQEMATTFEGSTGWELDACDLVSRRAYCDFTYDDPEWSLCDGVITVQYTRRGKLVSNFEVLDCDVDGS